MHFIVRHASATFYHTAHISRAHCTFAIRPGRVASFGVKGKLVADVHVRNGNWLVGEETFELSTDVLLAESSERTLNYGPTLCRVTIYFCV